MRGEKILVNLTLPQSSAGDGHAEKKSAALVQPIDFRMNGLANAPGPPADCLISLDSGQNRACNRVTEWHDDGREGDEVIVDSVSDYAVEDYLFWNSISEIHCNRLTRFHLLWSYRYIVEDEFGDAWGTVIYTQCR